MKFIHSLTIVMLTVGCAVTGSISGELLHGPVVEHSDTASKKVSVVFYRENSNDTKNVPTVFVDDQVVASFLPGEYRQIKISHNSVKLRVATRGEVVSKGASQVLHLPKNSITYVEILKTNNTLFSSKIVSEDQGKKALQKLDLTSNIINRYVNRSTLRTDLLFGFNSAKLRASAYPELDKLVHKIKTHTNQTDSIKIAGHTDRIGDAGFNKKLSVKRAKAVANYFAKKGMNQSIETTGYGSERPVTTNCKGELSPRLIQCLQADRRVEIEY